MKNVMIATILALVGSTSAFAAGQSVHGSAHETAPPAAQEYMSGMEKMHEDMMTGLMSSNPDVAFAKGMIAHHQGAIEMARTELKYGQDPQMKKLAQAIIDAQQPEIDQMQQWLGSQSGGKK